MRADSDAVERAVVDICAVMLTVCHAALDTFVRNFSHFFIPPDTFPVAHNYIAQIED